MTEWFSGVMFGFGFGWCIGRHFMRAKFQRLLDETRRLVGTPRP